MLFKLKTLEQIKCGNVTVAFRRWRRPTVKAGGSLKTPIGVLAITSVDKIPLSEITDSDAARAGFEKRSDLVQELKSRPGSVYRIEFVLAGKDPRIALRKSTEISEEELEKIREKLDRMDGASRDGSWTLKILKVIETHPHVVARELAAKTGFERDAFKINVRKLKNMGLTISHGFGYELSPRGKAVLDRL